MSQRIVVEFVNGLSVDLELDEAESGEWDQLEAELPRDPCWIRFYDGNSVHWFRAETVRRIYS